MKKKLLEFITTARQFIAVQLVGALSLSTDPMRSAITALRETLLIEARFAELKNLIEQCNEAALEKLFNWLSESGTPVFASMPLYADDEQAKAFVEKWNSFIGTWYPLSTVPRPVMTGMTGLPLTGLMADMEASPSLQMPKYQALLSKLYTAAQSDDLSPIMDVVIGDIAVLLPSNKRAEVIESLKKNLAVLEAQHADGQLELKEPELATPGGDAAPEPAATAPVDAPPTGPGANPPDVIIPPVS